MQRVAKKLKELIEGIPNIKLILDRIRRVFPQETEKCIKKEEDSILDLKIC